MRSDIPSKLRQNRRPADSTTNKSQLVKNLVEFQEMHWKTAFFVMIVTSQLSAAELEIPKVFVNGEVADAIDFNVNNEYLIDQIEGEIVRTDELLANAR